MSNAERQKRYRARKRNAPVTESPESVTVEPERNAPVPLGDIRLLADAACLQHYLDNQDKYVPCRESELLNGGPWMSMAQLETAGLKANRVAIPGDWDYDGEVA